MISAGTRGHSLTFLAAAATAFVLFLSGGVDAAMRRFSAGSCLPARKSADFRYDSAQGVVLNTSGIEALFCGVVEDTAIPVDTIQTITLHATNANPFGGLTASACVLFDQGNGGACGPTSFPSALGPSAVPVNPTIWRRTGVGEANAGDYPFLSISMGGPINGAFNGVRGFTIVQ